MNHQDLIYSCQNEWQSYTQHDFVIQLAEGKLASEAYLHYLKQDFLFLKQYARAYALAIYKARTLAEMRMVLPSVQGLLNNEIAHHIHYCRQWGISPDQMEAEPEDFGTVAYTRYFLDAGNSGDLTDLLVALAPCSIGYAEIGQQLSANQNSRSASNPYQSWIELYSGEEFQSGAQASIEQLNVLLSEIPLNSSRGQLLCDIFKTATRMEIAFWQQALDKQLPESENTIRK